MGIAKRFTMTLGEDHVETLGTIQHIDTLEFAAALLKEEIDYLKNVRAEVERKELASKENKPITKG